MTLWARALPHQKVYDFLMQQPLALSDKIPQERILSLLTLGSEAITDLLASLKTNKMDSIPIMTIFIENFCRLLSQLKLDTAHSELKNLYDYAWEQAQRIVSDYDAKQFLRPDIFLFNLFLEKRILLKALLSKPAPN